eukprot:3111327-Prymnesium_polylepis.2
MADKEGMQSRSHRYTSHISILSVPWLHPGTAYGTHIQLYAVAVTCVTCECRALTTHAYCTPAVVAVGGVPSARRAP